MSQARTRLKTIAISESWRILTPEKPRPLSVMLYYTGKSHKIGEVHDGAATMDWMEQEQERGITITSAATTTFWTCPWTSKECDRQRASRQHDRHARPRRLHDRGRAVACACSTVRSRCFDAKAGVEPQTETVWRQGDKLPCAADVLHQQDGQARSRFLRTQFDSIKDRLGAKTAIAVQLPIGAENDFAGIVDLIKMKAYYLGR